MFLLRGGGLPGKGFRPHRHGGGGRDRGPKSNVSGALIPGLILGAIRGVEDGRLSTYVSTEEHGVFECAFAK